MIQVTTNSNLKPNCDINVIQSHDMIVEANVTLKNRVLKDNINILYEVFIENEPIKKSIVVNVGDNEAIIKFAGYGNVVNSQKYDLYIKLTDSADVVFRCTEKLIGQYMAKMTSHSITDLVLDNYNKSRVHKESHDEKNLNDSEYLQNYLQAFETEENRLNELFSEWNIPGYSFGPEIKSIYSPSSCIISQNLSKEERIDNLFHQSANEYRVNYINQKDISNKFLLKAEERKKFHSFPIELLEYSMNQLVQASFLNCDLRVTVATFQGKWKTLEQYTSSSICYSDYLSWPEINRKYSSFATYIPSIPVLGPTLLYCPRGVRVVLCLDKREKNSIFRVYGAGLVDNNGDFLVIFT